MNKISQELVDHIEAANARIHAWVAEDPDNRWSTIFVSPVEDPEFYLEICDGTLPGYLEWAEMNDRACQEKEARKARYDY